MRTEQTPDLVIPPAHDPTAAAYGRPEAGGNPGIVANAWTDAIVQTTKTLPARWGRNDLPPDPFGTHKERGRLRAAEPTRGAGEIGSFTARVRYPARPDGQRDKADKRRGPGAILASAADPPALA